MYIKRAVWKRDQGQCTFVSASGTRCDAIRLLEFDHIQPVARGGTATVDGMRLRCHAHNQYEAERIFGAGFMAAKREATRIASEVRAGAEAKAKSQVPGKRSIQSRKVIQQGAPAVSGG